MLRLCERAAFADQAEASYALESEELQRGLEQGRFVVKTLHEYLQKEEERRRSVVDATAGVQDRARRTDDQTRTIGRLAGLD